MPLDTLTIKQKIVVTLDQDSSSSVVPIYNYVAYTKTGYRLINEYLEIENLKAVSWIYSLTPVEFPVFELEDTDSKQLLAAINLEWKSPRIQLDVVCEIDSSNNWQKIASYSLLNPNPYPYREYSLGNHALGSNSMIGLQVRDVGYGLLQNTSAGQDKVTVLADLTRQITIEKILDTSNKIANSITTAASTIVNPNPERTGITFFNSSSIIVYLDSVPTVSATSYLVKLDPGDYWEPPTSSYLGAYYGVVESGSAAIDIREFL